MAITSMDYDVRICSCGTIHFIPIHKINLAITQDKELLWICGRCGNATRIGADREPNDYFDGPDAPEYVYSMYSVDMIPNRDDQVRSIEEKDFRDGVEHKAYSEIFYSCGVQVPMRTGMHAKAYNPYSRKFLDIWYPDYWKLDGKDQTAEDIRRELSEYRKNSQIVNMHRFVRETRREYLEILAQTMWDEFDWSGTEFEELHNNYMKKLHHRAD